MSVLKKIFNRFALAGIVLIGFASCSKDNTKPEKPVVPEPEVAVPVKPIAREGWDIYTGPNYRYGPSIIINDDNSIDIWLATPGDYYGTNVIVPVSNAQTALQLGTTGVFAQKFTSEKDFGFISLQCPSWNSAAEGFTLKIYKWVNDYETTISGAAVSSKTFVNYADNSWLSIYKSDKEDYTETFPAGTYLWVMSSGTEKSGIWKCTDNGSTGSTGAVSYVDGKPVDGQFRCRITSNGSGDYFWDKITWRHSVDGGKTWTDEVDALLPKCVFFDPQTVAMKMVRMYRKNDPGLEKFFRKKGARLRKDACVLPVCLYAWILLKQGRNEEALKVLVDAKKKTSDETLIRNWEALANGRPKQFSNAGLGDMWYALGLEEPKMPRVQQQYRFR